jgi:hypothetical protein
MTTIMRDETTAVVARAVSAVNAARGSTVVEMPLLEMVHVSVAADTAMIPGVMSVEDRVVELVVDEEPFEAIAPAIWALDARGWNVVALALAGRLGEAHRALRGTPCRLQPWWRDGDEVRFGAFEIP